MSGAAITIGSGQVKYVLGFKINMGSSTRFQDYMQQYINNMNQFRWQEYIMGVTCIFLLVVFKVWTLKPRSVSPQFLTMKDKVWHTLLLIRLILQPFTFLLSSFILAVL